MNEKDVIQINSYEMEDIGAYMGRTSTNADTLHEESKQKFTPITQHGLFVEGMDAINGKIQRLSQKFNAAQRVIINGTQSMANLEAKLNQEAMTIEIPKNFEINNTVESSEFKTVTLNKNDGTSVNKGTRQEELNVEMNSAIQRENLGNINNNNTQQEAVLNDYTTQRTDLRDITGDETQARELNFRDVITRDNLGNINGSTQSLNANIDTNSHIDKVDLGSM